MHISGMYIVTVINKLPMPSFYFLRDLATLLLGTSGTSCPQSLLPECAQCASCLGKDRMCDALWFFLQPVSLLTSNSSAANYADVKAAHKSSERGHGYPLQGEKFN